MSTPSRQSARVQAIGLTRWSYPAAGQAFRRDARGLDQLRAQLYAPHRLDHRLFLLEHVLLPGLRRQSDPDFTHIFLMGDNLPDPWRARVLALLTSVRQVVPVFAPEGRPMNDLCREVIADHIAADATITAQYRLDDDDGLGFDFIRESRRLFEVVAPLYEGEKRFGLDFNRGFVPRSDASDLTLSPVSMRFWAPGMMVFQRRDAKRSALDFNHLRLWHYIPVKTWRETPMFIRGAHHDNDSEVFGRRARGFPFEPRNPTRYFKQTFGVNLPRMQKIWAAEKEHHMGSAQGEPRRAVNG